MNKCKQNRLGRTNLYCGEIGLGCEGFTKLDQVTANKIINEALDLGINFIDLYASNPLTRKTIGNALASRRKEMIIQGHLCTIWEDGQYERTRDINKTKESFKALLKDLNTDYIDIGMIHYIDEESDFNEVFNGLIIEYAKSLKEQGIIKHIGISSHNPLVGIKAVESGIIDVIMFSVNPCYDLLPASEDCDILWDKKSYDKKLKNFDPDRLKFYELCEKSDTAISVMKAFAGGDLLSDEMSPYGKAMTVSQCINYCITRPGVKVVLCGFHTYDEFKKDLEYIYATDLEKDFSSILNNAKNIKFTEHCVYCGHCAPCTKKIDIATVNKYLDLCIAQGEVPETIKNHYALLDVKASSCIECGLCETRCPFGVKIINKMKEAKNLLEK